MFCQVLLVHFLINTQKKLNNDSHVQNVEVYTKLKNIDEDDKKLSFLDNEMNKILKSKNFNINQKWYMYRQLLMQYAKFNRLKQQQQQQIPTPVKTDKFAQTYQRRIYTPLKKIITPEKKVITPEKMVDNMSMATQTNDSPRYNTEDIIEAVGINDSSQIGNFASYQSPINSPKKLPEIPINSSSLKHYFDKESGDVISFPDTGEGVQAYDEYINEKRGRAALDATQASVVKQKPAAKKQGISEPQHSSVSPMDISGINPIDLNDEVIITERQFLRPSVLKPKLTKTKKQRQPTLNESFKVVASATKPINRKRSQSKSPIRNQPAARRLRSNSTVARQEGKGKIRWKIYK